MRSKRGGENHILAERHPKTENFKNVDDKLHSEEERDDKLQTTEGESLDAAISVLKNAAEQRSYGQ